MAQCLKPVAAKMSTGSSPLGCPKMFSADRQQEEVSSQTVNEENRKKSPVRAWVSTPLQTEGKDPKEESAIA